MFRNEHYSCLKEEKKTHQGSYSFFLIKTILRYNNKIGDKFEFSFSLLLVL